ncbi:DNA polymerase III subunit alpha [Emticicia sp. BO119]|uniref:DNA polymerase III subunit alpha n=1 Tax=Emticicia sp. BO119 TaxID=2757768 RepID=UPI0015F10680|nr:DNA polymerase III subunit alpha [Emticicia sp. BO119]MBA4849044.1 DNA polymerase III subunit alpha [Emticicia sp. BO119]
MYLNSHSYYSLGYGTLSISDLVTKTRESGFKSLALTDINNVSGIFDFVKECKQENIKPMVGVDIRNTDEMLYFALAKNQDGLFEINQFLSVHLLTKKPFPHRMKFKYCFTIYSYTFLENNYILDENEYIGVRHWELIKLYKYQKNNGFEKLLAYHSITFSDKITFNLHRLLRAIGKNLLLSKLPKSAEAHSEELFYERDKLLNKFQHCQSALKNTAFVINNCNYDFDYKINKNKRLYTNKKEDDIQLVRKLALDGANKRYLPISDGIRERIEKELKVIDDMNFSSYFLITWDIIKYANNQGYFHVGRGSGANSIVAYCMGITDVDPVELDLFFERFINEHRTSPPDFDIDFSWDERNEIIEYVFNRYGKEYVCLLATYNTYQKNSAVRELGKVFGLPKSEIDELLKYPEKVFSNEYVRYIKQYAPLMQDMPHNLSIHAGGILISDKPLFHYTALQPVPKGFPICQWDMYVAEEIGFAKFDILSQRGLGHIKTAVDYIRENQQINVDIRRINDFKKDPKINAQLSTGETMGCFYVESPAMQQLIWKLGCDNYLTLVAASSIIRPGVSSSGMMKAYIERHHNPNLIKHLHPKMGEVLSETYGVMIYQEDVLKVAHEFAGLELSEADILRRAMSGKHRSRAEFERVTQKWFANCKAIGYSDEVAKEVWRQVESFASYSFSKAHSASYAVESYQSLYLKTYYPLEFITAVINNFGGFYRSEFYIYEAKRSGGVIELPDINESEIFVKLKGKTLWLGWVFLKGLEVKTIEKLLNERNNGGSFTSLSNFVHRVDISVEQLTILIRIGAFRSFGYSKKQLLWDALFLANRPVKPSSKKHSLFDYPEVDFKLPELIDYRLEEIYDQIEFMEFSIEPPFSYCTDTIDSKISALDLPKYKGKLIELFGYLVTYKPLRDKNGNRMCFGYFYDPTGHFFDTVHFSKSYDKYPFRGNGVYQLRGVVIEEFGFFSLNVNEMEKLAIQPDPRMENKPTVYEESFLISD